MLLSQTLTLDTCSSSQTSTLYDSYLNPVIYYASFSRDQNSFFKITNPFKDKQANQMSILFWARFPQISDDGSYQTGTFIDCSLSSVIRFMKDTIFFQVQNSQTASQVNITQQIFTNANQQLQQWNNFGVSIYKQSMYLYLNGFQVGSLNAGITYLGNTPSECYIGNSQTTSDPINAYLRSFLFTSNPLNIISNLQNYIHLLAMPTDSTILAYYRFSENFNNEQTYIHDSIDPTLYQNQNVQIQSSTEAEFICYCSGTYEKFLKMASDISLKSFSLSDKQISTNGFQIDFQIKALNPSTTQKDAVKIFNLDNYADIYLDLNLQFFRIDLFDSKQQVYTQFIIPSITFRFNFWTLYSIRITNNQINLYVDGTKTATMGYGVTLQTTTSSFNIISPQGFSYLANYVILRNGGGTSVISQYFSQDQSGILSAMVASGNLNFVLSNDNCTMSTANMTNYWNGMSCTDNRVATYFKGSTSDSNAKVSGQLKTSLSTMTLELWFKDSNLQLTSSTFQYLLQASQGGDPTLSVTIAGGSSTSQRLLFCNPTNSQFSLQISNSLNAWTHMACISNANENSLRLIAFVSTTQLQFDQTLQGTTFQNVDSNIDTSLGSALSGDQASRFQGFLKEFRIWNTARSSSQITTFRYSSINLQSSQISSGLLHYFRLYDQFNPLTLYSVVNTNQNLNENNQQNPMISYNIDKDVVICQQNYAFNGQCCSLFDVSQVNIFVSQDVTTNTINIGIDQSSIAVPYWVYSLKAQFSLVAIGRNFNYIDKGEIYDYQSLITPLFNQQNVQNFSIASDKISAAIFSITIQAVITSDFQPNFQVTKTSTLVLQCPNAWLYIAPQSISMTDIQIVSSAQADSSPLIQVMLQTECYSLVSGNLQLQNYSLPSVAWSWDSKTKFTNVFTIASDQQSVSVKSKSALSNNAYKISGVVKFTSPKVATVSSSINLQFSSTLQITGLTTSIPSSFQLVIGNQDSKISLSLSGFGSSNPSTNPVTYNVVCPFSLFVSSSTYNDYCKVDDQGNFNFPSSALVNGIVPSINSYTFTFYVILAQTSIVVSRSISVQIYQDGGSSDNCPRLSLNSIYTFNQYSQSLLQLVTNPYLYCSGTDTYYSVTSVAWTASDSKTNTSYNSIFGYDSQTVFMYASVTPKSSGSVLAGALVNVVATTQFTQINSSTKISRSTNSQIQFAQQALVPQIVVYNTKNVIITSSIDFLESQITLNAKSSYDPDSTSSINGYSWTCPDIVTQYYDCNSLVSSGYILTLTAYQRAKIQFNFVDSYEFKVTISSSNPYKQSQSQSVFLNFNPPSKADSSQTTFTSTCDSISATYGIGNLFKLNNTYPKVVAFSKFNYTNALFQEVYSQSSGNCKLGTIQEQRMLMYGFDNPMLSLSSTDPSLPQVLFAQDQSSPQMVTTQSVNVSLNSNFQSINDVNYYQYYQVNIYLFTQRISSTGTVSSSLAVDTVYYQKQAGALVAQLASSSITVDKYSNLVLDASPSYDPEQVSNSYSFIWTCPTKITACANQNSSTLILTPLDRAVGNNNVNGATYTYSVVMTDGIRVSNPVTANVLISMQSSYSNCFSASIDTTKFNGNYQDNQTLYIQYGRAYQIQVTVNNQPLCTYANVGSTSFSANSTKPFWTTDSPPSSSIYFDPTLISKYLVPNTMYTLLTSSAFTMGADTNVPYTLSNYLNVMLNNPDLIPVVTGPVIDVMSSSASTILSSSSSSDPAGVKFSSYWGCPDYLQLPSCGQTSSSSNTFQINQATLSTITNIADFYQQSHKFTLNLISNDLVRTASSSFYVLFANSGAFATASAVNSNCGINLINSISNNYIVFNQLQTLNFSCSNLTLANNLLANQSLSWSIDSLQSSRDYFSIDNGLYMKAYAGYNMQGNSLGEFVPTLQFTSNIDGTQTTFKASFKFIAQYLQSGQIFLSQPQLSGFAYSQPYNINFYGFSSSQKSGIQFQIRVFSQLYQCYTLILPIKQFSQSTINTYLSSIFLPYISEIKADFFDMNNVYIGSNDMMNSLFTQGISLGKLSQSDFESYFGRYVQFSASQSNSKSDNTLARQQFQIDMYNLRIVSEAMQFKIINKGDYLSYQNSVIDFLGTYFVNSLGQFSPSTSANDYYSKLAVERNCLYSLIGIVSKSNALTSDRIASFISVFDQLSQDYSFMTSEGDETESLRQIFVILFDVLNTQIQSSTDPNINKYSNSLNNIQTRIYGTDFSSLKKGGKPQFVITGQAVRQMYKLDNTNQNQVKFSNNFNSKESVVLMSQSYLASLNVSTVETIFKQQSNSSAPVSSIITINAYDVNNTNENLIFDQGQTIDITFQVSNATLYGNSSQSLISCVYYDYNNNYWSTSGIATNFDNVTGAVVCKTSHLSTFTVSYTNLTVNQIQNQTNVSNQTNSTNNTSVSTKKYFQENVGKYVGVCVLGIGYVIITIVITLIWTRTKTSYRPPSLEENKQELKLCSIYKECLLQCHTLLSSYIAPSKGNIYVSVPQYNQMIFTHVYFFIITILVEFIMEHKPQTQEEWKQNRLKRTIVIFFVFYVLKTFVYSINYCLYFRNYPIPSKEDREERKKNYEQNQQTEQQSLRNKDSSNRRNGNNNNDHFNYEGGEGEEAKKEDTNHLKPHGVSSNKPHKGSSPHQQKANNQNREDSIKDVELEDIDIEIEKSSKNQFFNKNKQSSLIGLMNQNQNQKDYTREDEFSSPEVAGKQSHQDNTNIKSGESKKKSRYDNGTDNLKRSTEEDFTNRKQEIKTSSRFKEPDQEQVEDQGKSISMTKYHFLEAAGPSNPLESPNSQSKKQDFQYVYDNSQSQPEKEQPQKTISPSKIEQQDDRKYDSPPPPKSKAGKWCGFVTKICFLIIKIVVTLIFLYKLPGIAAVQRFTRAVFAILILYEVIYEPIAFFIYAIIFKACNGTGVCLQVAGGLLFGNFHPNVARSILFSLNN